MEAWSGVLRRRGNTDQEIACRQALSAFVWVNFARTKSVDLLALNKKHRLRAADAGHFFCLKELSRGVEDLVLVSFDLEMVKAARNEGLAVWE